MRDRFKADKNDRRIRIKNIRSPGMMLDPGAEVEIRMFMAIMVHFSEQMMDFQGMPEWGGNYKNSTKHQRQGKFHLDPGHTHLKEIIHACIHHAASKVAKALLCVNAYCK